MEIIVCIKQVLDTKGGVAFNPDGTLSRAITLVTVSPDDEVRLKAVLRLKDELGAEVTVLTIGLPKATDMLHGVYATGVGKMTLVTNRALGGANAWAISSTTAAALRNLEHDLIITDRQAIDDDTAQVGPQIAEHLGFPVVSYAQNLKANGNYAIVQRQFKDRCHMLKVKLLYLCIAFTEPDPPHYMTVGRLFDAFGQDVTTWDEKDLPTLEDKDMGLAGSPTRIARASGKIKRGKGVRVNLGAQEPMKYLTGQLVEGHVI